MKSLAPYRLTAAGDGPLALNLPVAFATRLIAQFRMSRLVPGTTAPTRFPAAAFSQVGLSADLGLALDLRAPRPDPGIKPPETHLV